MTNEERKEKIEEEVVEETQEWKEQKGADFWNPEDVGEMIEGKVVSIKDGDFGKQYVVQKLNGDTIITPSHSMLQSLMVSVKEGDEVKVLYKGTKENPRRGLSDIKIYQVFVK